MSQLFRFDTMKIWNFCCNKSLFPVDSEWYDLPPTNGKDYMARLVHKAGLVENFILEN